MTTETFTTENRTAILADASACVLALVPFVIKCFGERPAPVFVLVLWGATREHNVPGAVLQAAVGSAEA